MRKRIIVIVIMMMTMMIQSWQVNSSLFSSFFVDPYYGDSPTRVSKTGSGVCLQFGSDWLGLATTIPALAPGTFWPLGPILSRTPWSAMGVSVVRNESNDSEARTCNNGFRTTPAWTTLRQELQAHRAALSRERIFENSPKNFEYDESHWRCEPIPLVTSTARMWLYNFPCLRDHHQSKTRARSKLTAR